MDALGIVLAVLVGLAVLAGIAFFGFVAWFIFKVFRQVFKGQKEFDKRWNEGPLQPTTQSISNALWWKQSYVGNAPMFFL